MSLSSVMSIVLPGRPDVGRLLVALPGSALLPHRRGHRVDPLLPPAGRAHPGVATRAGRSTTSLRDTGPAAVFRERVLCCFINDPVGVSLLDHFNLDNVCWESDYPHSDSSWPNAPEVNEAQFASLDEDVVDKITHRNAMQHFSFDPFATRPRERCTVGRVAGRGEGCGHRHAGRSSARPERSRLLQESERCRAPEHRELRLRAGARESLRAFPSRRPRGVIPTRGQSNGCSELPTAQVLKYWLLAP